MKLEKFWHVPFLRRVIFTGLIFFYANLPLVSATETLVFQGIPTREDHSNQNNLSKKDLPAEESQGLQLVIAKEKDKYLWKSSQNQELLHTERKNSHFFISMAGDGFIEIRLDPESKLYYYKENINTKDRKVTYYGTGKTLTL